MIKKMGLAALCTSLLAGYSFADSNATTVNAVVNAETVFVGVGGAGVFDHAGAVGDPLNSTTTATFVGGFTANQVNFTGLSTAVSTATWASEAAIQITDPGVTGSANWTSNGPSSTYFGTPFAYNNTVNITSSFAGGIDPSGTWGLEFFETFNDGDTAPDSYSSFVFMTFEETATTNFDSNGSFALGSLGLGDSTTSIGELAVGGVWDSYSLTLDSNSIFDFFTSPDADGFVGADLDTEIAIFDSLGTLIANNDDGGPFGGGGGDFYSGLFGVSLAAGDYTLVVAGFNSGFADGPNVSPGSSTGDYTLNASVRIPEPSSVAIFAMIGFGIVSRRRRA